MTNFTGTSIKLPEMIAQLELNEKHCTKLILQCDELDKASKEDLDRFFQALQNNNTLTNLELYETKNSDLIIERLTLALVNNKSITRIANNCIPFEKDKMPGMFELIERNRKLALEKNVNPVVVEIENLDVASDVEVSEFAFEMVDNGESDCLFTLVKARPQILSETDYLERTLLMVAAETGQVDCVKVLLQLGSNVNFNSQKFFHPAVKNGTALHYAVANSHYVVVRLLLSAGANVEEKRNGFTVITDVEDREITELLIAHKADVNHVCGQDTQAQHCTGYSVLHSIFYSKGVNGDVIACLLNAGANPNALDQHGNTPLHQLAQQHYQSLTRFQSCVNALLRAGADPLIKNNKGLTAYALVKNSDSEQDRARLAIFKAAINDAREIEKACVMMNVSRNINGIFARLPRDLLSLIAMHAADSNVLESDTKTAIINRVSVKHK